MREQNQISGNKDLLPILAEGFFLSLNITALIETCDHYWYYRNRGVKEYRQWETAEERLDTLLTRLYELKRKLSENPKNPDVKHLVSIV